MKNNKKNGCFCEHKNKVPLLRRAMACLNKKGVNASAY